MKKSDLRSGMVVRLRNGDLYITIDVEGKLIFTNGSGWNPLYNYREDLTEKNNFEELDVVGIYRGYCGNLGLMFNVNAEERIWEREEVTMKEVCEKFGCQVKIVEG